MNCTKEIIKKWFEILQFPEEWKEEVLSNAEKFDVSDIEKNEKPFTFLHELENKMPCLLYSLYKCEDFYNNGRAKDIPDSILISTLQEVRRHAKTYNETTGKIGNRQGKWMNCITSGKLYCLGRLEFEMRGAKYDFPDLSVTKGDEVLNIHIPKTDTPLSEDEYMRSFELAEEFFPKYFPDYKYKCFMCDSWLLDNTLKKFLKPTSNIVKFMDMFKIVNNTESDSAVRIAFRKPLTVEEAINITPKTSLQKGLREHIINGGKLYCSCGFMPKKK